MEQVSPTRMNLLLLRRQIKVAEQGVRLLKTKRDALFAEFRKMIEPLLERERELDRALQQATRVLTLALGVDGPERLASTAMVTRRKDLALEMKERKMWGVKMLDIAGVKLRRRFVDRGYSPLTVSTRIDFAAERFEEAVEILLALAPMEIRLKKLGEEIKKTTRRVNALEQKVIPELRQQTKFIRQVLEDREREDKFRLKRLKSKGSQKSYS